jgi:hypothetical protein
MAERKMVVFGHLGDGNIHLVISVGSLDAQAVHAVETLVYGALRPFRASSRPNTASDSSAEFLPFHATARK